MFSIHFERQFKTNDPHDYELIPKQEQLFKTFAYYSGGDQLAQSDEVYMLLGASSLLAKASVAAVLTAVALTF